MTRAVLALLLLAACFRGGELADPVTVENVAPAPTTLRIARVPPKVGSVRVESTVSRGTGMDSRKVTRVAILAVDGFASIKEKITYLEATGAEASLAGKSFIVTRVDDHIDVVATDGASAGDEEIVRMDNESLGEVDSTVLMVTERDFVVGQRVVVPAPKNLAPGSTVTLTLRAFDATSATFDVALKLGNIPMLTSAQGQMVVDRETGLDRTATLTMKMQQGRDVRTSTIEFQATTE